MFLQLSGFKKGALLYSRVFWQNGLSSSPFVDPFKSLSFFLMGASKSFLHYPQWIFLPQWISSGSSANRYSMLF